MILTGIARLGRNAEIRYAGDGTAVANLALAYNYGKKDGEGKRPTQWIDASLWGERATKLEQYLLKGQQLCVVLDDVSVHTFDKKDGTTGTSLRARVVSIEFAGSRPADAERAPATATAAPAAKPAVAKPAGKFDDFEDDIPF